MKMLRRLVLSLTILATTTLITVCGAANAETSTFVQNKPLRIALVNFKSCVEKSKLGKKEQAGFDAMKKQMESILLEKEKTLNEVATKFNDIDYLDSLSPDAEAELKRQFRNQTQEFTQQQNQFYQTLSQTNMVIIQKLTDAVSKASETVAKNNQIDIVLNDESSFYTVATIDVSDLVVTAMDEAYAKEGKDPKTESSLDLTK